jgi:Tol biopolymer transport system component
MPGLISTEHAEFDLIFTPDNNTVYFTRRVGEEKQKIYTSSYRDGQWSSPEIASFSTDRDEYPNLTPDGNTLYFGSERPIPARPNLGNFDTNIWKTTMENGVWTTPVPLDSTINRVQAEGEQWPLHNENHFNTSDRKTFYMCTMLRGEKGLDLYSTTLENGRYSEPEKLPQTINSEETWEYAPKLSPDGQYLFFQVYGRDDGLGGDDIFVSKKDGNGNWMPSKNLGALVNSAGHEAPFGMTSDSRFFFFGQVSEEAAAEYGPGKIFFVDTQALNLNKLFTP